MPNKAQSRTSLPGEVSKHVGGWDRSVGSKKCQAKNRDPSFRIASNHLRNRRNRQRSCRYTHACLCTCPCILLPGCAFMGRVQVALAANAQKNRVEIRTDLQDATKCIQHDRMGRGCCEEEAPKWPVRMTHYKSDRRRRGAP